MACGTALLPLPPFVQLQFAFPGLPESTLPLVGTPMERLQLQIALFAIERIISAVTDCPARAQFDNGVHSFQQSPVMAHDQHRRTAPADEIVQKVPCPGIEVIARFIQQNGIGPREFRTGQQNTRTFAAAQRTGPTVEGDCFDAPPFTHEGKPLFDAPIVIERRKIGFRTPPGLDGVQGVEFTGRTQQFRHRFIGSAEGVLRQIPAIGRTVDRTRRRQQSGGNAQQSSLARAVGPDQCDPFAGTDRESNIRKQGF